MQDGVTEAEGEVIYQLYRIGQNADGADTALAGMAWLQDDITEAEGEVIYHLYRIGQNADGADTALAGMAWLQDDITEPEVAAIEHLYQITRYDEDIVPSLLNMPFMLTVEPDDALALYAISYMGRRSDDHLEALKQSQIFKDGITDDLTTLIRAAGTIRDADALARWLVPGYASIEVHTGRTELTPELKISIFRDQGNARPETMPGVGANRGATREPHAGSAAQSPPRVRDQ